MRIGYADPPYPGCAGLYKDHPDYAGEVDHAELVARLEREYDGWVLHTHVPGLSVVLPLLPDGARVMAWVKTFSAFKRNIPVAYAWEPVIVKAARKPVVSKRDVSRDWAFERVGARPEDDLVDLYPGTGAVTSAWKSWRGLFVLPVDAPARTSRSAGVDR